MKIVEERAPNGALLDWKLTDDSGNSSDVLGFDIADSPTTTNGSYAAGDVIGGYRTIAAASVADAIFMLVTVQVIFKAAVQPTIRMVIFGGTPAALLNDNDAYSLSAADALLVKKQIDPLSWSAYMSHGTAKSKMAQPTVLMKPITGTVNLGYYLITDDAVTLTSTADVQLRFAGL